MGEKMKSVYFVVQIDKQCIEDVEEETFIRLIHDDQNYRDLPTKPVNGTSDVFAAKATLSVGWQVIQAGTVRKDGDLHLDESTHVFNVETDHLIFLAWGETMKKLRLYPGNQVVFVNLCPEDMGRMVVMGNCSQLGWFSHSVAVKQEHIRFSQGTIYSIPSVRGEDTLPFKLAHTDGFGIEWEEPPGYYKKVLVPSQGDVVVCNTWGKTEIDTTDITTELNTSESSMTDDEKANIGEANDAACQPPVQTTDEDATKAMGDHETEKCQLANSSIDAMKGDTANVQDKNTLVELHHLKVPEKSQADLALKASVHVQCNTESQMPNQAVLADGVTIQDSQLVHEAKMEGVELQDAVNAENTDQGDTVPTEDGKTLAAANTEGSKLVDAGNTDDMNWFIRITQ